MIKCDGGRIIINGTNDEIFTELCTIIIALNEHYDIEEIIKAIKNNKIRYKKKNGISITVDKIK